MCHSVTAKRPRTVIDHILKHGFVTTEELKTKYGYDHPPRAARDVRERGIGLETFRVKASNGRMIGAYRFTDPAKRRLRKLEGRTGLSKQIIDALVAKYGARCFIYLEEVTPQELQIDHRVPYEVGGESETLNPDDFMLLCGSANRAKSWACEHCENWKSLKQKEICMSCYWAYPDNYSHIAMRQVRRIDLMWKDQEIAAYERLKEDARRAKKTIPEFVKGLIDLVVGKSI
ncbi:MAG: HNH endonuclease [Anaerolineae bacterium]|nr:HNH endonuclease [Anaerolineae bacterium]